MSSVLSGRTALSRATAAGLSAVLLVTLGALLRPSAADSTVEVIYSSEAGKQNPDVALNANGDAVAVWAENNNTLKASVRPAGGSWSTPDTVGATDRGNPFPHVVIDSTGFITLTWTSTAGGTTHYMSVATRAIAGSWSAVADLDAGTYGENLTLDIDDAGTVTAAWQSPAADIRVAAHPAGSATWTTPVTIGAGYTPVLTHGASHHGLAWQSAATGSAATEVIASDGTWSAGGVETASAPDEAVYEPRIVFGPADAVEAVWSRATTDASDPEHPVTTEAIVSSQRTAPSTWTAGSVISSSGDQVRTAGAAIDSNGDMTVAYYRYTDSFATYALLTRTRHNGTWDVPTTLSTAVLSSGSLRLVVDAEDTFTAVWGDSPAKEATRTGTTTWTTADLSPDTGTVFGASVKLDGAGHALAAWTRQYNDGTFHANVEASFFTPAPPVDDTPPTTTLGALPAYSWASPVRVAWSASDSQSGVTGTDVRERTATWNKPFGAYRTVVSGSTGATAPIPVAPGTTDCFGARSHDGVGNVGGFTADRCTVVPADDVVAAHSRGWVRKRAAAYYRGSAFATTKKGATLTLRGVRAHRIALVVSRAPGNGTIAVFWRGARIGTYSLASAHARNRVVLTVHGSAALQTGTLVVKVLGKKHLVRIDGFAITG